MTDAALSAVLQTTGGLGISLDVHELKEGDIVLFYLLLIIARQ